METKFKVGDRVKPADADAATNIPAYRALVGSVIEVWPTGWLRVHWDCDRALGLSADYGARRPNSLVVVK